MAGKDTNIGWKRGREARQALDLAAGAAVGCVLATVEEDLGLPVVIAALPAGIAGCCWRDDERVVLWVNGTHAPVRQRFTLAHEVGHLRCGHDGAIPVETVVTLGGKTTDSREVQANAFAAEFLAPADGVRARLANAEPTLEDLVRIAARYGISTIAALYRINSLGLAPNYASLHAALDNGEHDGVWERLAPEPVDDLISSITSPDLPRLSPALGGSALAAVVHGSATIADAANASGCDPASLANGAGSIGV